MIDYATSRFEELVHGMDVVFDTVGGETLERSWKTLRPGGRLVTIVSAAGYSTDPRVKESFFIVEPNQKQLIDVGRLLDAGKPRPIVDSIVSLSGAPDVFSGRARRQGHGKVVIQIQNTD